MSPSTYRLLKVSPSVDAETQQVAEKLARFVAEGGPEVENIAAERNRDNPAFRSGSEYKLFLVRFYIIHFFCWRLMSVLFVTAFYMTHKVLGTASTKTKSRSIVPRPFPALYLHRNKQ